MKMTGSILVPLMAAAGLWICGTVAAQAQTTTQMVYHVSFDTSQLMDHPAEPFSLQLVLTDGSGTGDGNSSLTVTNFNLGTDGDADGDPDLDGDASGDLTTNIVMTDSLGEADFSEEFTPGEVLSFDVYVTLSLDSDGESDELAVAILDAEGQRIPTLDTDSEDAFVRLSTPDGVSMTAESYGTDASLEPYASGPPLVFGALVLLEGTSAPTAPSLTIADNKDGTANIQWPSSYDYYVLESSTDLFNWSYVGVSATVTNYQVFTNFTFMSVTNLLVNLSTVDPPIQFFRLAQ